MSHRTDIQHGGGISQGDAGGIAQVVGHDQCQHAIAYGGVSEVSDERSVEIIGVGRTVSVRGDSGTIERQAGGTNLDEVVAIFQVAFEGGIHILATNNVGIHESRGRGLINARGTAAAPDFSEANGSPIARNYGRRADKVEGGRITAASSARRDVDETRVAAGFKINEAVEVLEAGITAEGYHIQDTVRGGGTALKLAAPNFSERAGSE